LSAITPSTPSKAAAASLEEGDNSRTQGGEKSGDPAVKTETSMKRPRRSPDREDSDGSSSSSPSPLPRSAATSSKRSSDTRGSKYYRRYVKRKEKEEGEDSDVSVDSESDSDDLNETHSHSRSDMMRYPRRERRRRSPGSAPSRGGGGDQQSKIPTVCRHFLNGKLEN
jgi:hypothetical protein